MEICKSTTIYNRVGKITGFWYLATPYSKYPGGVDEAYLAALRVFEQLRQNKVLIYSPIAHTHGLAVRYNLDGNFKFWQKHNDIMIMASSGIIVAMLPSWKESRGIENEVEFAQRIGKPVIYYEV